MKNIKSLIAFAAFSIAASMQVVSAAPIDTLYNTGVDNSGVVRTDGSAETHYMLQPSAIPALMVATSAGGFPNDVWLGDNAVSGWIGPVADGQPRLNGNAGNYTFRTTFDLTGLNAATASISGQWSSDNAGVDILLNGVSLGFTNAFGTPGSYSFQTWSSFTIGSGFMNGINTLDFVVNNSSCDTCTWNPVGLRVEMTGTADVPAPGTLALLGLGVSALALRARRRQV